MCKYQFQDGSFCQERNFEDSECCILHEDLPEDKDSEEWEKLSQLKQKEFDRKVSLADYNFEGAIFGQLKFRGEITDSVNFNQAKFLGITWLGHSTFSKEAYFVKAVFSKLVVLVNATFLNDAFFNSAIFSGGVFFNKSTFLKTVTFTNALFSDSLCFDNASFLKEADFNRVKFSKEAGFEGATFSEDAWFIEASFLNNTTFNNVIFSGYAGFERAKFYGKTYFDGVTFLGETAFNIFSTQRILNFLNSEFKKTLIIYASECGNDIKIRINHSTINGDLDIIFPELGQNSIIELIGTKVEGNLSLNETVILGMANFNNLAVSGKIDIIPDNIRNPYAQENIFRKVKTHGAELGDKKTSDEFFFLEKVAGKEILKNEIINSVQKIKQFSSFQDYRRNLKQLFKQLFKYIIEIPMQYYFCYGINPLRTFGFWIVIILIFSLFFWQFSWIEYNIPTTSANITLFGFDLTDYPRVFFFSVTNAMTPGYGLMHPKDGWPQIWAGVEAIFGAFTWGCFLTIFARKYMDK